MSDAEAESDQTISLPVPVPRAADRAAQRPKSPNRVYVRKEILPTGATIYRLKEEGYKLVEQMSANGNDLATIARALGMDRHTFQTLRDRDARAASAVETGRALMSDELHDILMEKARAGETVAAIFLARSRAGWNNDAGAIEGMPQPKVVNNTQINIQLVEPLTPEQFRQITQGAQAIAADPIPAGSPSIPPDRERR